MIEVKSLSKVYKAKEGDVQALFGIDLSLPSKGLVFVTGKSGSGKSTLLNIIGGLDRPTSGSIFYDGLDISALSESDLCKYRNGHVGFVFQDFALLENATVYANVKLALDLLDEKDDGRIDEVLRKLDILGLKDRKASQLSAGQKQRVSIARAIVKRPKVLLCDEPTGNLDTDTGRLILDFLAEVSKESLVLVISHNANDSYKHADRIIRLSEGEIVEDLSTEHGNSKYHLQDGILYINDVKEFDDGDERAVNGLLKNGEVHEIKSIKGLFYPTPISSEAKHDGAKLKKPRLKSRSVFHFFKEILGGGKNLTRLGCLIAIASAVVSLFGVCQMAVNFDSSSVSSKCIEESSLPATPILKTSLSEYDYSNTGLYKIAPLTDEEESDFLSNGYLLTNVDFVPYYEYQAYGSAQLLTRGSRSPSSSPYFWSVYNSYNNGTYIVTEEGLKDILGIDEITYLAEASEYKDYGIYITDYQADKAMIGLGCGYEDLVGRMVDKYVPHGYVNGIIDTGYKTRYASLFEQYSSNKDDLDFSSDEYTEFYEYAVNALECSYSFEEDFLDLYCNLENRSVVSYKEVYFLGLMDDENEVSPNAYNSDYSICAADLYNLDVPDKGASIGYTSLNEMTGYSYTSAEWEERLANEKITLRIETYLGETFDYVLDELKLTASADRHLYLGDEAFLDILRHQVCAFGSSIPDKQKAVGLYEKYCDSGFIVNLTSITAATYVGNIIASYFGLFNFIGYILLACSVFLLLYCSYDSVKRKKYEIGVMKALGASITDLNRVYLVNFAIAIGFSLIFYFAFVSVFRYACNTILITAINSLKLGSAYLNGITIFAFSPEVVWIDLAVLLFSFLVGFVFPLFKIRNIKPMEILRNKY